MAEINATCALAITAETLSAWRDRQVKATTAEQLDQHVPTCTACQRELTRFEMVARALHRQRELEPGNRIWHGVQTQIAGRRHSGIHSNSRALLGGISGVIIVVLLGFVFARVLGGSGKSTGPTPTAIAPPQSTETTTPVPTASGSPTTTSVSTITIAQAWGPNAAQQTLTTPSDATHVFQAQNITRDGTMLLGNQLIFTSNSKYSPGPSDERAGLLTIATGQFTDIGLAAPIGGLLGSPGCCMTDGRFLVAEDSDQPGVTCGVCHVRVWSYDLQTSQPARLVAASATAGGEIDSALFDHGILALGVLNATTVFKFIDLATLQTTTFTPGGGQQASAPIMSFNWPYVIYAVSTPTGPGNDTTRIYNVTTKSDIALPQGAATGAIDSAVITGDTLFYSQTNVGTFEVDHFTTPGAQPHLLTPLTGKLSGVNGRVLLIDDIGTGEYMAWDRAEHRLVQLAPPPAANSEVDISAALSGDLLIITQASSIYAPQQVAVYDTTKLPTAGA